MMTHCTLYAQSLILFPAFRHQVVAESLLHSPRFIFLQSSLGLRAIPLRRRRSSLRHEQLQLGRSSRSRLQLRQQLLAAATTAIASTATSAAATTTTAAADAASVLSDA